MTLRVRRARAEDAALVSSLNADVQALHAAALPHRFKSPTAETFPPAEAAELLNNPATLAFIAEIDSVPAGYAYAEKMAQPETSFRHAYEMVYIHHVSVRPQFRRRGVGTALLAAVRTAASDAGLTLIALDVWTFNDVARAFFARHGFTAYNERLWNR
jgi:ribosomal protein S18 acetylase RimI-like enzyme